MTTRTNGNNNHPSSHPSLFRLRTTFRMMDIARLLPFFHFRTACVDVASRARHFCEDHAIFLRRLRNDCGNCVQRIQGRYFESIKALPQLNFDVNARS
jgi:hypothetical protein